MSKGPKCQHYANQVDETYLYKQVQDIINAILHENDNWSKMLFLKAPIKKRSNKAPSANDGRIRDRRK
jgi:hypothetical protein